MKNLVFLILLIFINSCGGSDGRESSRAVVIKLSQFSNAFYNPLDVLIPKAHAAVSDTKLCVFQIRFKTSENDPTNNQDNNQSIALAAGEVIVSGSGTILGTINVKDGIYTNIELDLDTSCESEKSLSFTNDNGSFSSAENMSLKFTGVLEISGSFTLSLDPQKQMDALSGWNTTSDEEDLDTIIQAISGDLP